MQDLGEQVSQVLLCWDVGNEGFSHCYSLTYCMIADQVRFLLECRLRLAHVGNYRHVVTIHIGGLIHWDTHHAELVAYTTQILNAVSQGAKFGAKH